MAGFFGDEEADGTGGYDRGENDKRGSSAPTPEEETPTVTPTSMRHLREMVSRRRSSMELFLTNDDKTQGFNKDVSVSVSVDTNLISWHVGEHCMNCYLGQAHECWDPQYARDLYGTIQRRVFFIGNGEGTFELGDKKEDGSYAVITYIVRYAPNTPELPYHDHPRGEEYLVLKGSFDDPNAPACPMTYGKYPCDTAHAATPNKEEGCEVLTWWGQNDNDDEGQRLSWWPEHTTAKTVQAMSIKFDPESPHWETAEWGHFLPLFKAKKSGEQTFVAKINKDRTLTHVVPEGGLELFVLSGSFVDRGGVLVDSKGRMESVDPEFSQGWWLREAGRTSSVELLTFYSKEGCTLIVKINHLPATMEQRKSRTCPPTNKVSPTLHFMSRRLS